VSSRLTTPEGAGAERAPESGTPAPESASTGAGAAAGGATLMATLARLDAPTRAGVVAGLQRSHGNVAVGSLAGASGLQVGTIPTRSYFALNPPIPVDGAIVGPAAPDAATVRWSAAVAGREHEVVTRGDVARHPELDGLRRSFEARVAAAPSGEGEQEGEG
jgi:hypothetical protein